MTVPVITFTRTRYLVSLNGTIHHVRRDRICDCAGTPANPCPAIPLVQDYLAGIVGPNPPVVPRLRLPHRRRPVSQQPGRTRLAVQLCQLPPLLAGSNGTAAPLPGHPSAELSLPLVRHTRGGTPGVAGSTLPPSPPGADDRRQASCSGQKGNEPGRCWRFVHKIPLSVHKHTRLVHSKSPGVHNLHSGSKPGFRTRPKHPDRPALVTVRQPLTGKPDGLCQDPGTKTAPESCHFCARVARRH